MTAIHGMGSVVCVALAVGSLVPEFREALALSPGARLMITLFGSWTFLFLAAVATLLAFLAYGSFLRRAWAWPLTISCYGVGVVGSLWEVSIGIRQAWISAAINAVVVAYAMAPPVRRGYLGVEALDEDWAVH